MLVGEFPFKGATEQEILRKIMSTNIEKISGSGISNNRRMSNEAA